MHDEFTIRRARRSRGARVRSRHPAKPAADVRTGRYNDDIDADHHNDGPSDQHRPSDHDHHDNHNHNHNHDDDARALGRLRPELRGPR